MNPPALTPRDLPPQFEDQLVGSFIYSMKRIISAIVANPSLSASGAWQLHFIITGVMAVRG
jgi:hypothetical protein